MHRSLGAFVLGLACASAAAVAYASGAPHVAAPASAPGGDGCSRAYCPGDAVFQAVPLQGLLAGVLESPIAFGSVLEHGDFGLGGLSPLDGEAIVLDGEAYHARLDGSLRTIDPGERASVLWVKRFRPDRRLVLGSIGGFDALAAALDAGTGSPNRIHAIRVDGTFERVRLRSVPRQSPPYVPVAEVVKSQRVFTLEKVEGTLVGFRFPAWAAGVNAPGYHFHFVDAGRRAGGHLLDLRATGLTARVDTTRALTVITPDHVLFDDATLDAPTDENAYRRALRPGHGGSGATP
ncbi:acetolactate decarboxylase [Luteimonas sp. RD2P54]|uniref:Alpha-acetolactate decarboxylase n=1 Tax=Luteimonas endophytica TaxID=3042023 RepID=A0ABT6JBP9_9GAMM|nr:acetolactate decarboxylase [Luteimonas endophytica]MDH5824226.1 acetolactate decarboxylase [Luteimonas endophytica]